MISAAVLIAEARRMVETPYVHLGRLPGVGIDCFGLLVLAAAAVGAPFEDGRPYRAAPSPRWMLGELARRMDRVAGLEPRPGLVATFGCPDPKRPQHFGLLTDYRHGGGETIGILHTYAEVGRVVETGLGGVWRTRLHGLWRIRGVDAWPA